jgi:hypothetical protein
MVMKGFDLAAIAEQLFVLSTVVAAALLAVLLATLARPKLRIWPTPGVGTWQSYLWWPLFRGLNALCFAVAVLGWGQWAGLGLPAGVRTLAAAGLVASVAVFVAAFRLLGRDNSYGAQDGLVTGGIYQWSRNPQNTMLAVVYGCLAVAADSWRSYLLCAAMIAVYVLMVLAEEPWLERTYGETYRHYTSEVPRFFHWRRFLRGRAGRPEAPNHRRPGR